MKRIIALILAMTLIVGALASCSGGGNSSSVSSDSSSEGDASSLLSEKLVALFKETVRNNPEKSGEEIADMIAASELLSGREFTTYNHLDTEFMAGFDGEFAPEEFKKATYIGPVMNDLFIAYVFELDDSTDAEKYAAYVEEHADPAWNVCMVADQVACGSERNMVFLVMCSESQTDSVDYNQQLVDSFKEYMASGDDLSAESIAAHLSETESFPLDLDSVAVEEGYLAGLGELEGFSEGAKFAPIIGSIPFVGYVFTVDADVDGEVFAETLKSQANPAWNVCTQADLVITECYKGSEGSTVLFIMCPENY